MNRYAEQSRWLNDSGTHGKELWRTLAGLMLIITGVFTFSLAMFTGMGDGLDSDTPLGAVILLMGFGIWIAVTAAVGTILHDRHPVTYVASASSFVSRPVVTNLLVALVVLNLVLFALPPWDLGTEFARPINVWAIWVPFGLLAIFIQVSAEEYLFRGYLQQQLAGRWNHPACWMILPSTLFGLGHYMPDLAGDNAWLIVVWAFIFGCLMADITARAGSIWPAIILHFVNNVIAILIVSPPGDLDGLALLHAPFTLSDVDMVRMWLPVDFALMIVSWLLARLILRR